MKKLLFLFLLFMVFSSHDMFLKLDTYFLAPNSKATLDLFNGTFDKSDNVITRDRMLDVSMVSAGKRTALDTAQWTDVDSTTVLNFTTGEEGTYVVGVSTAARNIEMDAEAFNSYLEHDGVLDMIALRKSSGTFGEDAIEKYSKHVKAIFQVGNVKTDDWNAELGYPIEFIPMSNPYDLHTGDQLKVKLLANGKPLSNQLVYTDSRASLNGHSHDEHSHEDDHSHEHDGNEHSHDGEGESHSHDHEEDGGHTHTSGEQLRTDANGMVTMDLNKDGIYYLRTINLVVSEEEGLTHESNWATLTFEVGHDHPVAGAAEHDHDHEHEDDSPFGIPSYAYWLGSLVLVGILFFFFYKKSNAEGEKK